MTPPTGVRWTPPRSADQPNLEMFPGACRNPVSGERIVAWMVLSLLLTCTAVALYDAYLLLWALR